jgi:hypothetical protein
VRKGRAVALIAVATVFLAGSAFYLFGRGIWFPLVLQIRGERTVAQVIARYGPNTRERLKPDFERAGITYPPKQIAILVFKKERRVAVWAKKDGPWRFIRDYPILAASGHAGPKLMQGDDQVPEGVYRIAHLNPNSSYHLSMKVSYPNEFDRRMAASDGRTNLGGDIFIHGKNVSIGCVAIGDRAIEELFTLVAETGHHRVKVIIAPNDLRAGRAVTHERAPRWVGRLHTIVAAALGEFPLRLESNAAIDVRGMEKKTFLLK